MGAILYELLAGHMPYVEPGVRVSPRTVLRWVLDGPPRQLGANYPEVAPELVAICEKAMAREMADRYPSMEELAEDLRAYLEQRVVRAYAVGPLAELRKWVARNRLVAAFTLVALIVVAGLGFGLAWQQAQTNRVITQERDRADAERKRVMRISDGRRLEELVAEMDELWPALPETEAAMQGWIGRARDQLTRLPQHEQTLSELRSRAVAGPHRLDSEMRKFLEHKAADQAVALGGEFKTEEERAEHIAELDYWIVEMQKVMDREREFSFGDDLDTAWWHDALYELVMGLRDLAEDDPVGPSVRNIEQRLEYTQSTQRISIFDHAEEWDLALTSIADPDQCPLYDGLELEPQLGLVPIGQDRESGLWEFWHLQTGEKPGRTPRGELIYSEDSGLVFVLIPGGHFLMGAQADDPTRPQYDPGASHDEVNRDGELVPMELSPFFLSKYEMTQGQWLRITGQSPSYYGKNLKRPDLRVHSLLCPVESVTWDTATEVLHKRLRMDLPTEAQWEYACRAGTESVWWTGDEPESLEGAANLADLSAARAGADWEACANTTLDDGYYATAPVNLFRANGFGLHNMTGNAWEWVQDSYGHYSEPAREGDGLRVTATKTKVLRGGSFNEAPRRSRSAHRGRLERSHRRTSIGVRPARAID